MEAPRFVAGLAAASLALGGCSAVAREPLSPSDVTRQVQIQKERQALELLRGKATHDVREMGFTIRDAYQEPSFFRNKPYKKNMYTQESSFGQKLFYYDLTYQTAKEITSLKVGFAVDDQNEIDPYRAKELSTYHSSANGEQEFLSFQQDGKEWIVTTSKGEFSTEPTGMQKLLTNDNFKDFRIKAQALIKLATETVPAKESKQEREMKKKGKAYINGVAQRLIENINDRKLQFDGNVLMRYFDPNFPPNTIVYEVKMGNLDLRVVGEQEDGHGELNPKKTQAVYVKQTLQNTRKGTSVLQYDFESKPEGFRAQSSAGLEEWRSYSTNPDFFRNEQLTPDNFNDLKAGANPFIDQMLGK